MGFESYLAEVTWLSLLLIIGIVCSIIAVKLKIPEILLFIIVGVLIGQFSLISFVPAFLSGFAIFALIMIIFDSSTQFNPNQIGILSPYAMKLAFVSSLIMFVLLSVIVHLIFGFDFNIHAFIVSGIFGGVMAGTSPTAVLGIFENNKNRIVEILELESILNTPLTIIIPIILLSLYQGSLAAGEIFVTFLQNIMTGIGTGVVTGLVIYRMMKKTYTQNISPLIIIATALITYTLSEYLGGNGVLAVTALGVIYGLSSLKEKQELKRFSSTFTHFLKILIFILLGLVIKIPFNDIEFLVKSLIMFILYLIIRFLAVSLTFNNTNIELKERIFMSLTASKGIAVAVVVFTLLSYVDTLSGLKILLDLSLLFILYSIIVASITAKLNSYFVSPHHNLKYIKK